MKQDLEQVIYSLKLSKEHFEKEILYLTEKSERLKSEQEYTASLCCIDHLISLKVIVTGYEKTIQRIESIIAGNCL